MVFADPTNLTRIHLMLQYGNSVSGFMLGNVILIMVFGVTFISSFGGSGRSDQALILASFTTFIVAVGLRILELVGDFSVIIPAVVAIFSSLVLLKRRR